MNKEDRPQLVKIAIFKSSHPSALEIRVNKWLKARELEGYYFRDKSVATIPATDNGTSAQIVVTIGVERFRTLDDVDLRMGS